MPRAAQGQGRARRSRSAICSASAIPAHEERTAEILAEEEPDWRISLSSRVLPVIREYPRLSTTVVDAYVGPIMERYLVEPRPPAQGARHRDAAGFPDAVERRADAHHHGRALSQPDTDLRARRPASSPASRSRARPGGSNLVTLDIGGTSTDISVIVGWARRARRANGRIAGQDIGTPMLAVHTLGAGGGTIAWIGRDGLMKVGPQSAGAVPGPACYGRGGTAPTVTDANLVLGALGAKQRARRPHGARPRARRARHHGRTSRGRSGSI